ncbi:hypothetical protein SAMN04515671_2444 [Nakamurella panacisegetis]|uniref:Copper(I)-binding protein n=1 Tax=Nakamurella panacisegetis TaxID=1090615 RepID=A0A1H0NQX1_9ACTN|nr:hypothetical protein [Nakamurella panacisegetis]SDO94845.1 hypothetical protein SAMN04515671_2444 [Nakamurella panacisegetis]
MSRTARLPRRVLVPVAAVLAAALTLSGCAAGQISQTANQVAAIDGANGTSGNIGVRNALLAVPTGATQKTGYAKGADAPLELWVSNAGLDTYKLSGVTSSAAASVQITGSAAVPPQSLTDFTGTSVTLTMKNLTSAVTYGQSVPVTFTFDPGTANPTGAGPVTVTVNVPVAIPAERTGGRPTIVIQPTEGGNVWDSESPESSGSGG